jgi:hypothetical protein
MISWWWLFFASVIIIIFVGTHRVVQVEEGYDTRDATCGNDAWIRTCLDVSNGDIHDYETFFKIVDYLTVETNDIQTRAKIQFSVDPVVMQYVNPVLLQDPNSSAAIQTVKIAGQVPNLTFQFRYPAPPQGPVGPTGPPGDSGSSGPVGPTGPLGQPALQQPLA